MSQTPDELKHMILQFRLSELQTLLAFAGKNKSGRKSHLQARAVTLAKQRKQHIVKKIKDLYKGIPRSTEELRQHVAAALQQQQELQQARRATSRQAALDRSSATSSQSLHPRAATAATVSSSGTTDPQEFFRRAALQQTSGLGLEVMSYGPRGTQGGGSNPHLHANKVPPMPLSTMAYAQQTGVPTQARGYSAAVASAAGLAMPYAAAAAALSAQQLTASYPINPDVKLKKLPFYDILAELLKPSSLAPQASGRYQESGFSFSLTPQQANKIANSRDLRPGKQDYNVQVQMRFCLLETSCEQEDNFPPNIAVKINDKMCPLPSPIPTNKPGVEPKRPSRPVNITALCRISPTVTNRVQVSWASEYGRCYVISVYLVQKLSSDDLLHRLKSKGVRIADFTRSLIKQKLNEDADCEIATTSLRCSLMCPLGKMRMLLPCRANTCNHLQCFDASLYLQMNERKPTWTCPVCDKPAIYDTLVIDGYFQDVLRLNTTSNEVTLHKDGSWSPLLPKKERPEPQAEKRKSIVAIETLSDSDDDATVTTSASSGPKVVIDDSIVEEVPTGEAGDVANKKASDVEIITLETSSEEEDDDDEDEDDDTNPPPAKRPYNPAFASTGTTDNTAGSNGCITDIASAAAASSNSNDGATLAVTTDSNPGDLAPSLLSPLTSPDLQLQHPSTSQPTPVISASVASSLAQLPTATTVLATTGNCDGGGTTVAPATDSPCESDGAKSDDSWSVGTVDPGKRLIFRKSMSCSSNGTSATTTATANGASSCSTTTTTNSFSSCASVILSPTTHQHNHPDLLATCSTPSSPVPSTATDAINGSSGACHNESRESVLSINTNGSSKDDSSTPHNPNKLIPRPIRTSSRATRFQGITWEGDSDTSTEDSDEETDDEDDDGGGGGGGGGGSSTTSLAVHNSSVGGSGRRGRRRRGGGGSGSSRSRAASTSSNASNASSSAPPMSDGGGVDIRAGGADVIRPLHSGSEH